jgi:hypothetical protein
MTGAADDLELAFIALQKANDKESLHRAVDALEKALKKLRDEIKANKPQETNPPPK